jgi:hypothetical protein
MKYGIYIRKENSTEVEFIDSFVADYYDEYNDILCDTVEANGYDLYEDDIIVKEIF